MSDVDGYIPFDPVRVCDTCGNARRMSSIRFLPGGVTSCDLDAGERSAVELDRANARQKPFLILPVKNARPENNTGPESYEADEGPILNFVARAISAMERYEDCLNGDEAATTLGNDRIGALAWSAVYLYGIIVENKRPLSWISRAKSLLADCVTSLLANQVGFGISTSATRANSAFFGAILEPDATTYVTENTTMGGLALLYSYRITGTLRHLEAARAAANYLRNVQAIGSNGTNFTSSDASGTARLYTGALASSVSTTAGMYSNSLFYPSDLLALKFWKELTTTDGDQSIGATAVVTGFDTAPSALMSACMADLRAFWLTGIADTGTADVITGLSATTPRECFNAYPVTKPNFTSVVGSGEWEYQDGATDTGTTITAQNFAKALHALYFYDGGSTQVTTVDAWLRSFDSNADFETPAGTSTRNLYRSLTGEYDPTYTLSTLLLVRDADDSYAPIAENGSDLYDWGAFGLLAQAWNGLHASSFIESRKVPLGVQQRFYDGRPTDQDHYDRITTLGRSGLSLQTYLVGSSESGGSGQITEPGPGMFWWGIGDQDVTLNGASEVTRWGDQSPYAKDVIDCASSGGRPHVQANALNGRSGIRFSRTISGNRFLESIGLPFTIQPTDPLTVYSVIVPLNSTAGALFAANGEGDTVPPNRSLMLYTDGGGTQYGAADFSGPDCIVTPTVDYTGIPLIVAHYTEYNSGTGLIDVWVSVNGSPLTLSHSTMLPGSARDRFFVGGYFMTGGLFQGGADVDMLEQVAYLDNLRGTSTDGRNMVYFNQTWLNPPVTVATIDQVNDVVRSSQFAQSFRYSVNFPPQV